MTTATIIDIEKLLGPYLRSHADIAALTSRVVVQTPENKDTPWIKMTLLDAANEFGMTPDYLITYMMQFDCYAGRSGGQPEANTLGYTARAALNAAAGQRLSSTAGTAVVTRVRFSNMARVPDPDGFEPARDRVILDALITAHVQT